MSKIAEGLTHAVGAARCQHKFVPVSGPTPPTGRVVARCPKCACRFTAWPDTIHYGEIIAAIRAAGQK